MSEDLETLTASEVAAALKINEQVARRWIRTGKIPGFQLGEGRGGDMRVRRVDFRKWMEAQPATGTPTIGAGET